ncbi:hypothetical protein [Litchfieldia alkalitelluris]|uniref:hypothetical protein n=1 Tax=Litchfieldia alkalitelluris TaxID=304268 RepID=UPI00195A798C|nr:hypothetical protein [Litchfieldia alkalitelluris]
MGINKRNVYRCLRYPVQQVSANQDTFPLIGQFDPPQYSFLFASKSNYIVSINGKTMLYRHSFMV